MIQILKATTSILITVFLTLIPTWLQAQQSSFTYQGELRSNGSPVNDSLGMTFSLFDSIAGGSQAGNDIFIPDVLVNNGLFTVDLDFGATAFNNSERWLEICVDGYVLSPRTKISRSPYSIQTRGIFVDANENVGIGTTHPQAQMHLEASEANLRMTTTDGSPTTVSRLQLQTAAAPGIFTPLGRLEFLDEQNNLRASITGTAAGGTGSILSFNTNPNFPQMTLDGDKTTIEGDTLINGIIESTNSILHVQKGAAGNVVPHIGSTAIFESDSTNFISLLTANNVSSGILFGTPDEGVLDANITFSSASDRMTIGTSIGGATISITDSDRVGVNNLLPQADLDIDGDLIVRDKQWTGLLPGGLDFGQLTVAQDPSSSLFAVDARSSDDNLPTILATNNGSGGVLWAQGVSDVSLAGGGVIVIGDQSGLNMGIDNNEIMARNAGQPSTLFLNESGGEVSMGENRIHPALAYGYIRNQSLFSGSSNIVSIDILDLFADGEGDTFEITFTTPLNTSDIAMATDASTTGRQFASTQITGGKLRITPFSEASSFQLSDVSFVVYRP